LAQNAFSFCRDHVLGSKELVEDARFKLHARTVFRMVETAVQLLEKRDMVTLISALRQLGARHHKYNIDQDHYPVVVVALMQTLELALVVTIFPEDVKQEWGTVAKLIFTTMMTTW
jgi:hemoglobin-like flavoprotein